jgi:signal recognition particle subunit SRP54
MVLEGLGAKLTSALRSMQASTVIDEKVLNDLVKAIAMALLQADVDVRLVKQLQTNIKAKANLDDLAPGVNKRKVIQSVSPSLSLRVCVCLSLSAASLPSSLPPLCLSPPCFCLSSPCLCLSPPCLCLSPPCLYHLSAFLSTSLPLASLSLLSIPLIFAPPSPLPPSSLPPSPLPLPPPQVVIRELMALLDPGKKPFEPKKGRENVIMFVGLQGSGKTTSCTKLAYYYKKKGWKVGLVCADTFRAGAFDQLKQNATKAKIPFYGSYTESDPAVIAEDGVRQFREQKFEIIIVDTSGRHKQEAALFQEMQMVAKVSAPDEVIFVMDSSIGQAARLQAEAFQEAVDVGSVIITKLDGHAKGGGALSAVAATKSPIVFVGTGEHMTDFEKFSAQSFVSRLLGMGDIRGLLNMFQDEKMFEKTKEAALYKKITSGQGSFTFRDMYEQFQNLLSLGPLGKVMGMIPGLSGIVGKSSEEESSNRLKSFLVIMDSFTNEELDSDIKLFNKQQSRIKRVARGSGHSIRHVEEVLAVFKPFEKVASKLKTMGKGGLDPRKMTGAQGMRQMQQMFDPRMIAKMGGMGNIQKMMKQFGGAMPGGMPP